jgi:CRISPR-associated protein Cmr2
MNQFLIAISIGPVQGFIAAARRTRDFWMGSTILSEVAKAVSKWIIDRPPNESQEARLGRLIFPAPLQPADLDPWTLHPDAEAPLSDFNVTNVILCRIDSDNPADFARDARRIAEERWEAFADRIAGQVLRGRDGGEHKVVEDTDDHWRAQRTRRFDVFEFFCAWVPFDGSDYVGARAAVMRLLDGRKALRDFRAWRGAAGKPKSSLDGARESVLKPPGQRLLPLRIKKDEQLDIVGLVKRVEFGNDAIRFPSISRFAADPWIRGLLGSAHGASALAQIEQQCRVLLKHNALRIRRDLPGQPIEDDLKKFPWLSAFPFEGTPLFVSRHRELVRDHPDYREPTESGFGQWQRLRAEIEGALSGIGAILRGFKRAFGEPNPYFAVLAADGDQMGRTIATLARLDDPAVHRAFSWAQSTFAERARALINGREPSGSGGERVNGATAYAGADDVLAFVPLDQCIRCARDLAMLFEDTLREHLGKVAPQAVKHLERNGPFPTLSVGLAIGHFMEPLEDLLEYAREAERRAKNPSPDEERRDQRPRNGLAVALHPRSGVSLTVRDNWQRDDPAWKGLDQRLLTWAQLHRQRLIPTRAAYDLRLLARDYEGTWPDVASRTRALRADGLRLFARKRGQRDGSAGRAELAELIGVIEGPDDLKALAEELIVGQRIGDAMDQASGGGIHQPALIEAVP